MPAHFMVLDNVYKQASDGLKSAMLYATMAAFNNEPIDLRAYAEDPNDDTLTALRKAQERERITHERHQMWTYDDFMKRLYDLVHAGLGEPFAITSLFRSIEDNLAFYNREADRPEVSTEDIVARFEKMRDEDHPENRDRYQGLIDMVRQRDERAPRFKAENRAVYEEWRALAGERVDMPTVVGCWLDLVDEDNRRSSG